MIRRTYGLGNRKKTDAEKVYEARAAYYEANDPNWSVWGAFMTWLKKLIGKK